MLKPLASGQANKVPLRNWDGWIQASLMVKVNPFLAEEDFVYLKDNGLAFTIGMHQLVVKVRSIYS